MMPRTGRPKLPKLESMTKTIICRLDIPAFAVIRDAIKKSKMSKSAWVRWKLLDAATDDICPQRTRQEPPKHPIDESKAF